jgi:predicted DNA-binding transcriptional regulator YafY
MRADRLVAILLMLQRRERVTCAEVAEELEVSERTARRDLESLAMAGVPVYSQQGRGGGWFLAGGGRIDLSGLSAQEARALFLLTGPRAETTPEVRSALRKLVRALPEPLRGSAETAAGAVVIDPTGWDRSYESPWRPPLLDEIEAAVVDGECLRIGYTGRRGEPSERVVHPLGLAVKGRHWYLLTSTDSGPRTFRVDRITAATRTGERVVRPEGFELAEEWSQIVQHVDVMRTPVVAVGTAIADAAAPLRAVFGRRVEIEEPGEPDGPHRVRVRGASVRSIAAEIAGFGDWVQLESPPELCELLADIGQQLVRQYDR